MGVSLIPTGTFIVISTVGRLFGTIMLSIMGAFAGNGQYTFLIIILVVGVAIFVMAYYYHYKILALLKKRKA
jgi:uncharacterized membrane protein YdjX (TVP38/TMEM64 family)